MKQMTVSLEYFPEVGNIFTTEDEFCTVVEVLSADTVMAACEPRKRVRRRRKPTAHQENQNNRAVDRILHDVELEAALCYT